MMAQEWHTGAGFPGLYRRVVRLSCNGPGPEMWPDPFSQ